MVCTLSHAFALARFEFPESAILGAVGPLSAFLSNSALLRSSHAMMNPDKVDLCQPEASNSTVFCELLVDLFLIVNLVKESWPE